MRIQEIKKVTRLALAVILLMAGVPGAAGVAERYVMPRRGNVLRDMLARNSFTAILNGRILIPDAEIPLSGPLEAPMESDVEVAEVISFEEPEAEAEEPAAEAGYTIRYQEEDGTLLFSEVVAEGMLAQGPEAIPEREGFVFLCWVDAETAEVFDFGQPLPGDVTLIAAYEADALPQAETTPDAAAILLLGEATAQPRETEIEETQAMDAESILGIAVLAPQETEAARETEAAAETAREVRVRLEASGPLNLGDTFTLRAELDGYEAGTYSLQWQYSNQDGIWQNIEGEHGESLTQTLNRENARYSWRVLVDR